MAYRAVIFDLGGVVLASPLESFRAYERAHGLPHRFISEMVVRGGDDGAWSRLERGELSPDAFAAAFEAECAAAGQTIAVADLFGSLGSGGGTGGDAGRGGESVPRPEMVTTIRALRAHGVRTGALTNNWAAADGTTHITGDSPLAAALADLFDTIVESALVGLRKPDPRIYELACNQLGVAPAEAVFLDDLGTNLKPARAMGMATIKVEDPHVAIAELAHIVGLDLT